MLQDYTQQNYWRIDYATSKLSYFLSLHHEGSRTKMDYNLWSEIIHSVQIFDNKEQLQKYEMQF